MGTLSDAGEAGGFAGVKGMAMVLVCEHNGVGISSQLIVDQPD